MTTHSEISPTPITVTYGNGIGPEIMAATLEVLDAAGAALAVEEIEVGEQVFARGVASGIEPAAFESLRRTKVFLKAPITTPQGGGLKSVNVTIRSVLGLFANIRPCPSYAPFVATKHPQMDLVIVRENEEDLYVGIEHRHSADVVQALKLISRPASERIIRYAFEFARRSGRKKVSCFTKDNILKLTDGLFHRVFDEIAGEYPDIENEHWIVDIGAALLADSPELFDVIVLPNLYGDILSDVAAQITGSIGLGGSANIGDEIAMFEAIHGSAPRIAGQGIANPSGLILAAVQMLEYLGQGVVATSVHNAWLATIEEGIHTVDIFDPSVSKQQANTAAFTAAVIERLGSTPQHLRPVSYAAAPEPIRVKPSARPTVEKRQLGLDVFFESTRSTAELVALLARGAGDALDLDLISNRAQLLYPAEGARAPASDHFRARYRTRDGATLCTPEALALLGRLSALGIEFVQVCGLFSFDGEEAFSVGQGQ